MLKFFVLFIPFFIWAQKPDLFLLKVYNEDINVTGWLMSEKLDGVRAYWNGKQLISRSGKVFASPAWFTKDFPAFELDGELYLARGKFEQTVAIVNKKQPHEGWKNITYNIFEVPHAKGFLLDRLALVKEQKYIKVIPQIVCKNKQHLDSYLKSLLKKGAEGVVVRRADRAYKTGRLKSALKVKKFLDDECVVTGYTKGKGKLKGKMGALLCSYKDKVLKIGSGFSDKQRTHPPKIGDQITFKYYGLTAKGNPRFPVFLRIRNAW